MIGLFKQKSPGNVVLLGLFGLVLKLPLFLFPKPVAASAADGRLYTLFLRATGIGTLSLVCSALSFCLLYAQALMLNYLVTEYRMLPRQNFLPGMAYLMATSLLPDWSYLSAPLVANTLIIWLFIVLFRLYNVDKGKGRVYNIGLIAGLASFIYFPSGTFAICVILGILILKPFRPEEAILFLLGCFTSYYFHAVYLYLKDRLNFANFFPHISIKVPVIQSSWQVIVTIILLLLPFLVGGYFVQMNLRKMVIQARKAWAILLIYSVMACFVPFINSTGDFDTWILITAPLAAFAASAYFYITKKTASLVLFFLTLAFILFIEYGTAGWR